MKRMFEESAFSFIVAVALALCGCTTKREANLRAQEAFLAGQQQVILQQQQQTATTNIQITGDVRNQLIEWREGLRLTEALAEAVYIGNRDPGLIVIFGQNRIRSVNPKDLLRGKDELLQPGDRIEIRR